jgi:predicted RNase H-like HicB family nuclease
LKRKRCIFVKILRDKKMVATTMERPETVALTYDKSNPMATQTLDYFTSLGLFLVEKSQREAVFEEKYKDKVLNMEYAAIVREIEDGWYMAQCEQLQGALTQGQTILEAKENLKDAIYLLLEDEMEDFRKDNPTL